MANVLTRDLSGSLLLRGAAVPAAWRWHWMVVGAAGAGLANWLPDCTVRAIQNALFNSLMKGQAWKTRPFLWRFEGFLSEVRRLHAHGIPDSALFLGLWLAFVAWRLIRRGGLGAEIQILPDAQPMVARALLRVAVRAGAIMAIIAWLAGGVGVILLGSVGMGWLVAPSFPELRPLDELMYANLRTPGAYLCGWLLVEASLVAKYGAIILAMLGTAIQHERRRRALFAALGVGLVCELLYLATEHFVGGAHAFFPRFNSGIASIAFGVSGVRLALAVALAWAADKFIRQRMTLA